MKKILLLLLLLSFTLIGADKKIVLVAGKDSHGYGDHEFRAGCNILANCLKKSGLPVSVTVINELQWPSSNTVFDEADAIIVYSDGSGGHPLEKDSRFSYFNELVKKGKSVGFMHYACEVKDDKGDIMTDWIGGYYKNNFSTNPHWVCSSMIDKKHPAANGVNNFKLRDEWYFNIKFGKDVFKVLQGIPTKEDRQGKTSWPRGPHKHIVEAEGRVETLLWTIERADGGRGFGFTGGHVHWNWKDDNYRKLILNTIVWSAGIKVPENGVSSATPTKEEMEANMKPKKK
ncbi:MAG: ThuA domain-containing protein [Lentisphaeraceae bacterium]|nr:ThuA domain-containing protein [Lentisphaeraceae bacterium]